MLSEVINEITKTVERLLPSGLPEEAQRNLRAALQSAFERMDLVTREELEVQEAVLARTRERLEALERRIQELEAKPPPKTKT